MEREKKGGGGRRCARVRSGSGGGEPPRQPDGLREPVEKKNVFVVVPLCAPPVATVTAHRMTFILIVVSCCARSVVCILDLVISSRTWCAKSLPSSANCAYVLIAPPALPPHFPCIYNKCVQICQLVVSQYNLLSLCVF